jgi:hypothetical protein
MYLLLRGDLWERQIVELCHEGSAMTGQRATVAQAPFGPAQLRRWLELFDDVVDDYFPERSGECGGCGDRQRATYEVTEPVGEI